MIGLVVVTHGRLADEFVSAMQHVVGPQEQVRTVCIGPNDDMEQRRTEILTAIRECETGDGVVVFTDMFGGTPSNLAISAMGAGKVEVIAGVNLPMLVKFAEIRGKQDLAAASQSAHDAGHKFIKVVSDILQPSS